MTYSIEETNLNQILVDSITNKTVLHVKNFTKDFLTWEDFINIINYQYANSRAQETPDKVKNQKTGVPTKISKYTEFHYHLLELTDTENPKYNFEESYPPINFLMSYMRDAIKPRATLKALVNIVGNDFVGNKHHDPYHVFSMQHIGSVEYNIFDENDVLTQYILEPGDLIFMPAGTTHSITAPSPRGTLILDIEQYK